MCKRQVFTVLSLSLLLVVAGAYALMASGQNTEATACCGTSCEGTGCDGGGCNGGDCGSCSPGDCATGSSCAARTGAAVKHAGLQRIAAGCSGSTCAPGQGCTPQTGCSAGGCSGSSFVRIIGVRNANTGRIAYYAVPVGQARALQARTAGKVARTAVGPDVAMAASAGTNAKPVR